MIYKYLLFIFICCNCAFSSGLTEKDYKFTVIEKKVDNVNQLALDLQKELHEYLRDNDLGFEKYHRKKFQITPIQDIFFVDQYYDSKDLCALKHNMLFRMRKRFPNNIINRYLYKLILPYRYEIQFKYGYRFYKDFYEAQEIRVEKDAILKYLKDKKAYSNGLASLIREISSKQKKCPNMNMKKVVTNKMTRLRFHLKMDTIWGSGNNPGDVILISIDKFCAKKQCQNNGFVEIELQIERNIKNLFSEPSSKDKRDFEIIINNRQLLLEDYEQLKKIISKFLLKRFGNSLPIMNKYQRIIQ